MSEPHAVRDVGEDAANHQKPAPSARAHSTAASVPDDVLRCGRRVGGQTWHRLGCRRRVRRRAVVSIPSAGILFAPGAQMRCSMSWPILGMPNARGLARRTALACAVRYWARLASSAAEQPNAAGRHSSGVSLRRLQTLRKVLTQRPSPNRGQAQRCTI